MKEKEEILNDIMDLMIEYGPDRHTDGSDKITEYIIKERDEYADWKIKECLPKKMPGYFDVNDYEEGCTVGFNRCIDKILSNKDKK